MKHFYTLLFLLVSLTVSYQSVAQGSLAALDAKNGFRDVKFGASIKSYPGMTLAEDDYPLATTKTYVRKADKLRIGDVKISTIFYRFFKGHLSDVSFILNGKKESDELLKAFEYLYGPHQTENNWTKWETGKILVWYLPNEAMDGSTFTQVVFISKEMFDLIGKDDTINNEAELKRRMLEEKDRIKKKASDL